MPRSAFSVSVVRVSFIGQPETVSRMVALARPDSSTSADSTMPSSVMGLRISGSMTVLNASRSISSVIVGWVEAIGPC